MLLQGLLTVVHLAFIIPVKLAHNEYYTCKTGYGWTRGGFHSLYMVCLSFRSCFQEVDRIQLRRAESHCLVPCVGGYVIGRPMEATM
eukprot:4305041-Amphidinium_carterae.1